MMKLEVESEKYVNLDLSMFEQTPQLVLARTWDEVYVRCVGCTRYFVGLI